MPKSADNVKMLRTVARIGEFFARSIDADVDDTVRLRDPIELAVNAGLSVAPRGVALACRTLVVSETFFRYSPQRNADNDEIADLLLEVAKVNMTWCFGLCFLHMRNVQGPRWNHNVYRLYRMFEPNLRSKPGRRLKREKPKELAVFDAPNMVWSMHFMLNYLAEGRQFTPANNTRAGLVRQFDQGVVASPGDAQRPAEVIARLADLSSAALAQLGTNARRFYDEHLSFERGARSFAGVLRGVARKRKGE